jgi:hypothetical protein
VGAPGPPEPEVREEGLEAGHEDSREGREEPFAKALNPMEQQMKAIEKEEIADDDTKSVYGPERAKAARLSTRTRTTSTPWMGRS